MQLLIPYLCLPFGKLMSNRRKIAFHTFGCKLNFAETSTIGRSLPEQGYELVDHRERADIYVIHSCTVTEAAEKKCNQFIRRLKRGNPSSVIVVMGCYAELKSRKLATMPEVDLVLGNESKYALAEHLRSLTAGSRFAVPEGSPESNPVFVPAFSLHDRTRSFLKVQDGCDNFCHYCIIPFVRGRSKSAPVRSVLESARMIHEAGVQEIVLTGVNIGDFGKHHGESLYDLLVQMEEQITVPRIRISSIEPDLLTNAIIHLVASSGKIMPHFHIPLQSGSDRILALMKRNYRRELFADRIARIRSILPDSCIAVDVIVGFPGETDADFTETIDFIQNTDLSYVHVFTYSERPGTVASRMENKIRPEIKKVRSQQLHVLSENKKKLFYHKNKGTTHQVLFESDPIKTELFGFTENYIHVKAPYDQNLVNQIIPVKLIKLDENEFYDYEG
ncbi:MAG TPA: tRNA (N(6)-L-threonylcarbamoyladenosine(37)-C(2))-methylthiotransferase MtaB [Bacteroidales bacterium]|nr:tRNA (N(6)-L-threonylcarbamoyladenosine(37)-C(2))-methylthiotransferase MtaB [Bacteroidales bacterium]